MAFLAIHKSVILPKRFSFKQEKRSLDVGFSFPTSWFLKDMFIFIFVRFRGLTSLLNQFVFSWISAPSLHEAIEKEGILETFSNNSLDQPPFSKQRGYQARATQGAPFCHDRTITGKHQQRVGACLIGIQVRFCTAWTLEPVLGFAFICFYICQVELLEASKL